MTAGRRRALTILAGAACLPLAGGAERAAGTVHRWTGRALGAEAEMRFADSPAGAARSAAAACQREVDRLDAVFSLWRGDSELSRLNRDGALAAPSLDLRAVLGRALEIAEASGGAFDPSVQPLWQCYAELAAAGRLAADGPPADQLAAARRLVDWRAVELGSGRVALARPSMALTLNGIAQGYITDRIARLLRRRGFAAVLVQLGETYALGAPAAGPWRVAGSGRVWPLADRALATSAGGRFSADGRTPHLLDPERGRSAQQVRAVTVAHDSAMTADSLSTALALLPVAEGRRLLRSFAGAARWRTADGPIDSA